LLSSKLSMSSYESCLCEKLNTLSSVINVQNITANIETASWKSGSVIHFSVQTL
jgi:hypothetical protein